MTMRCRLPVVLTIIWLMVRVSFTAQGTTIIPFTDLGALTHYSDAVVIATVLDQYAVELDGETRFNIKLKVSKTIKGTLHEDIDFEVQRWEKVIDDKWMTMWGDLDLYEGASYLLFLDKRPSGLYHPLCFSYYVFEELTMNGVSYLVPSEGAREFTLHKDTETEPLAVYQKKELIASLSRVVAGEEWNSNIARTGLSQDDFYHFDNQRAVPSECTYMTAAGRNIRWNVFEDNSVGIHYTQGGAAGCSSSIARTQAAISGLQAAYPDINITDQGTVVNFANCADETAMGSDFRSWVNSNLGGYRNIVIFYDDPCDEVTDLDNCGGILAIGGLYSIGKHTYDGVDWGTGQYGYVVLNDGLGACKCNNEFTEVLMHEISHALGLGHIASGEGAANMNPSCCNEITALDQGCMEYPYEAGEQSLLPLELIGFEGHSRGYNNHLRWETAWEQDVEGFILERADAQSDGQFREVTTILSRGNSEAGHVYEWIDRTGAPGDNYYRLRNRDLDGSEDLSQIVTIKQEARSHSEIYPSHTRDELHLVRASEGHARVQIVDQNGIVHQDAVVQSMNETVSVGTLPAGWYYLHLADASELNTYRFYKIE